MPVESATYVHDLVATYPQGPEGVSQGDDHLRLLKSTLQATFPNATGAITGTPAQLNAAATAFATPSSVVVPASGTTHQGGAVTLSGQGADPAAAFSLYNGVVGVSVGGTAIVSVSAAGLGVAGVMNASSVLQGGNVLIPAGIITLWYGIVAAIPAGWHLCDGTAGTPDLRDRFVVGAGNSYSPGQTGGSISVTGTTSTYAGHSHGGATAAAGGHAHTGASDTQGYHDHGGTQGHVLSVAEMPSHNHNLEMGVAGGGGIYVAQAGAGVGPYGSAIDYAGGGAAHSHGINADGAHSHALTVFGVGDHAHAIGNDGAHNHTLTIDTRSPYYALCYIMKA